VRFGAKLPNSGPLPEGLGIATMAGRLEEWGFDSIWVSDHVVFPTAIQSRYPFAADGRITWPIDTPWYDAVVALTLAAAATSRVELGVAVLVGALRNPVIFAKQAASIDRVAAGRLTLGVGAGWLAEEFDLLQVPFRGRGKRLDEWIALLRECWTGEAGPFNGRHYRLPARLLAYPTPAHEIEILVGGMSRAALIRAGWLGNGWLGLQRVQALDIAGLRGAVGTMRQSALSAGRADAGRLRAVLRLSDSANAVDRVAASLVPLAEAGITDVIVDVAWEAPERTSRAVELWRKALPG
jgi:probable F420-dependent oxidoreductase